MPPMTELLLFPVSSANTVAEVCLENKVYCMLVFHRKYEFRQIALPNAVPGSVVKSTLTL